MTIVHAREAEPREDRAHLQVPDVTGSTPRLELDVTVALDALREWQARLPTTHLHYAVKANPHPALLSALAAGGARFDVASPHEIELAVSAGARAGDLIYSNPVKRAEDIEAAAARGVRVFAADSPSEIDKLARIAPGVGVLVRLMTSGDGSAWPLSRKYGVDPALATSLLRLAGDIGLDPAGLAFHVGSQQLDPTAWQPPVMEAARVFDDLRALGLRPWLLDLGGGFPAAHGDDVTPPRVQDYAHTIQNALRSAFGDHLPATVIEPGRGIVGDAGTLVTRVIGVTWRSGVRWVYLDAGVFTGLVETLDEAIRYRLRTERDAEPMGPAVLAGPTCDSADVLYERRPVLLPLTLVEGDEVRLLSAGAYTTSYATVGFNGFAPLPTRLV